MATLDELPLDGRARVVRVDGGDDVGLRLLEMGLTPGVEVRILGFAPLGDPLELYLRGYTMTLRKEDAARIEVRPKEEI